MDLHNETGELVATDTFTRACPTCRGTVAVVEGIEQQHDCGWCEYGCPCHTPPPYLPAVSAQPDEESE